MTAPKGAGGGHYTEADALILQRIAAGVTTFSSLWSGSGMQYRAVDRRLQSLRKRGLIRFHKGHWHLTDAALSNIEGGRHG